MPKNVGMMQPYLFPYLGYFQLISAVDSFVLGDDLQYVKEGWMNRNRILVAGREKLFTFPLKKGSHTQSINERFFPDNFSDELDRLLKMISHSYLKAPCYKKAFPLIEEIMRTPESNLAKYAANAISRICNYLHITTPIFLSSELSLKEGMDRQERVVATARRLEANVYINPIGGISLYDPGYFSEYDIALKFHRMNDVQYRQFGNQFIPSLSIIDVLMFNDIPEVQQMLACYSLQDSFGNPVPH